MILKLKQLFRVMLKYKRNHYSIGFNFEQVTIQLGCIVKLIQFATRNKKPLYKQQKLQIEVNYSNL